MSKTKRFPTREVFIGPLGVGGTHPVRIQSMTTSNTRDVPATVEQIMRLADHGCEIARVTVQGIKEAEACEDIKNSLIQRGYIIPLVADIHFFPPAALRAVDFVDKIRINPGNYIDKRASFKKEEYDEISYQKELEKIEERLLPLIEKCKRLKRAMRIGTNHGSLSDRIMNRYGDTPLGMVESALEFAQVCRKYDYHELIFSMKSSNPHVMIAAYRLLVIRMIDLGWNYPLHLGVTEAGEGEDGRIKSAIGIGTLLLDGLGDTIRVSLTEDPWHEIDPCKRLIALASHSPCSDHILDPFQIPSPLSRYLPILHKDLPLHRDGSVFVTLASENLTDPMLYQNLGLKKQPDLLLKTSSSVDCIIASSEEAIPQNLQQTNIPILIPSTNTLHLLSDLPNSCTILTITDHPEHTWNDLTSSTPDLIILSPSSKDTLHYARRFCKWLQEHKILSPVILSFTYSCSKEDLIIQASAELGSLLCDGIGHGLWIQAPFDTNFLRTLSLNILQAARMRSSKTSFISCPGCGRTLFDLQEVSQRIRLKTAHLPGVKIAIMGCIVNGPGEMADADFGYVGSKTGMIDLYVGKECVEKNIPSVEADHRLIELIKHHGRWLEPEFSQ